MREAADKSVGPDTIEYCKSSIRVGSLSFSMASRLLGKRTRDAISMLYSWCRYCDDMIDKTSAETSLAAKKKQLANLRTQTRAAFKGHVSMHPAFSAFRYLVQAFDLPRHYPEELLNGMEMDILGKRYETLEDLHLYCYRVAGTVGLMFAHVIGVSDQKALQKAASLGMAMQLTNIARDLVEDAKLGRVYVPGTWLDEVGSTRNDVLNAENRHLLAKLAERLLTEADRLYKEGEEGIRYLPWRAALAVRAAHYIYADIGRMIRVRGERAWDRRTWVPTARKLLLMWRAVRETCRSIPGRLREPWRPVVIQSVWRLP